ncbi:WecB/TagA/CpsF family glycosyltransferase [Carboxydothermus hydrogenoformans]|uniref:N-acetylglucosaminyldiphosphoundecaprenol N-acetyl-beta-D-mannosaminyltransferase n=1 Tax=Carboxydothermus hydrogenoformans (strain ATCC BAA-161 / DSM 6008 / Z-2901) TaxID=246194 RepID=Q3A906_CARHZ|nr:WecB/TagA/CpsF family glycosyltransferase [Carboxydothermus hydrogenoformans]ABB14221.1 glycosyl transferase, WecB/TagA/CpsF family [Carboxydothermus hydrogenoformans Z-2901]
MAVIKIYDFPVASLSLNEAVNKVIKLIEERRKAHIITINPEMIYAALNNPDLKQLVLNADLILPDGVGIVLAGKIKGQSFKERVPGIELVEGVIRKKDNLKVYLIGAKPGVAEKAAIKLLEFNNTVEIVGIENGYFTNDEEKIEQIIKGNPELVLVGMGFPRQEIFIRNLLAKSPEPMVAVGIGGSFDVWAGVTKRAPKFMQKAGLEWLWRLIQEPWRYKRMMVLPKFALKVLVDYKLRGRKDW